VKTSLRGSALSTKPFQTGTALPGSCGTGQIFFLSNATAGSNTYGCIANVWTLQGGGGGGAWGGITGILSNQTDLQAALNARITAGLVLTVGSPGVDTNVASEKAVRTAIAAVVTSWGQIAGTLSSQTDLQTALNSKPTAVLVTSVGTPGSNSNVPSEAAVRSAITSGNPPGGGTNSLQTNSGSGTFQGNTGDTLDPGTGGMKLRYGLQTGQAATASGGWQPAGLTSGMAGIAVADVAGKSSGGRAPDQRRDLRPGRRHHRKKRDVSHQSDVVWWNLRSTGLRQRWGDRIQSV
jgi:hypothetical protein